MEHYCLGKNHKSRTLSIPAAKSQNFVNFTGAQNPHQAIFGTRYNIINMKLIMFLKNVNQKTVRLSFKKRYSNMSDNSKNFIINGALSKHFS